MGRSERVSARREATQAGWRLAKSSLSALSSPLWWIRRFVGRRVPARVVVLIHYAAVPPLAGTAVLPLSNSKSPPFVVSAILLRRISAIRHYLSEDVTKKMLPAFVLSRLDYCNQLLAGCPKYLLSKLRKVRNNAARLIFRTTRSAHVTPMLHSLHWLPIEQRIEYKLSFDHFSSGSHLPFRTSSPLHSLPAAPLFYRHPSVQNTTILPNKVLWSALFLLPGSSCLEPTPCFCPPFYLCQLF